MKLYTAVALAVGREGLIEMATYIALTTLNYQQNGYREVLRGSNKADLEKQAREQIGDVATEYGTDIHKVTEQRNLIVISKSEASRKGYI
jgi:hypothetical protein